MARVTEMEMGSSWEENVDLLGSDSQTSRHTPTWSKVGLSILVSITAVACIIAVVATGRGGGQVTPPNFSALVQETGAVDCTGYEPGSYGWKQAVWWSTHGNNPAWPQDENYRRAYEESKLIVSACSGTATTPSCVADSSCNCICANGVGATGAACTSMNALICASCETGYTKNGASTACEANACTSGLPTGASVVTTACTGKKTTEQCVVTCALGYAGTQQTFTCNADGSFGGTTPTCTPQECNDHPDWTSTPGILPDCDGLTTGQTCQVSCDTANGWTGTATTNTCDASNNIGGPLPTCSEPKCTLPATTTGYDTTGCPASNGGTPIAAGSCTLSCLAGYNGNAAMATCTADNGVFNGGTLTGCSANVCNCPNGVATVATGTGATLCETDQARDCSACNAGYTESAAFGTGFQTCEANVCTLPAVVPPGYDTSSCNAPNGGTAIAVASCTLSCAAGYNGPTPTATCGTNNGEFGGLTGCAANECTLPAVVPPGYDTSGCNAPNGGSPTVAVSCTLSCAAGYNGPTPTATCDTDLGEFGGLTGCSENTCVCTNGNPTTGTDCGTQGDTDCSSCTATFGPTDVLGTGNQDCLACDALPGTAAECERDAGSGIANCEYSETHGCRSTR